MGNKENLIVPKHVAIIMDGNNRWALKKKLPGVDGHKIGVERAQEAVEFAIELGIETLTLFAFSSENWGRSSSEVTLLMNLLNEALKEQVPNLVKNSVQLKFIGDLSKFDELLLKEMKESEKKTYCENSSKKLDLVIAASYGGRWDILQAVNKIIEEKKEALTEPEFALYLSTAGFTDPDLCIRTGLETRISNFLLWQFAYCELYFPEILWPDFDRSEFIKAIEEYSKRTRRFGDRSNFQETNETTS
tara:strand:- start:129230 stop:129970 length:741 start_codon:yes stop_codon:yes gene_type:complete